MAGRRQERFKPLDYRKAGQPPAPAPKPALTLPRIVKSSRVHRANPNFISKTITVLRNEDAFFAGIKMVLNARTGSSIVDLLDHISERVLLRTGVARKLSVAACGDRGRTGGRGRGLTVGAVAGGRRFSPDGRRVHSIDEIEHNGVYVAAGTERFVALAYLKPPPAPPPAVVVSSPTKAAPPMVRRLSTMAYAFASHAGTSPPKRYADKAKAAAAARGGGQDTGKPAVAKPLATGRALDNEILRAGREARLAALEVQVQRAVRDPAQMKALWDSLDVNGNGAVSLAGGRLRPRWSAALVNCRLT